MPENGSSSPASAQDAPTAGQGEVSAQLCAVLTRWLEATSAQERERREAQLDRAVRDTYPASDPIAAQTGQGARDTLLEVDCHLAEGRLTMLARLVSGTGSASRIEPDPSDSFEADGPGGMRMRVKVFDNSSAPEPVPAPRRSSETDVVDRPGASDETGAASGSSVDWPAVERRLAERRAHDRRAMSR